MYLHNYFFPLAVQGFCSVTCNIAHLTPNRTYLNAIFIYELHFPFDGIHNIILYYLTQQITAISETQQHSAALSLSHGQCC